MRILYKIKFLIKYLIDILKYYFFRTANRMNDDKLVSITRIHIHALERSQIEHNNFVIVLYMLIVAPLYKNVIRRNLFTNEEKEWANRIIYSEYRGIDLHENSYDDFAKVIRNRRSVRRFNEKKITKEQIYKIIDSGIWAPSACNRQPWNFIVVTHDKDRILLSNMVGKFIFNAPAGIIILINRHAYKESDIGYTPYLDCGVAAQNMVLTAYSLGLGSCLVNLGKKELGEKNENVVRQHFNISDDWILAMYIAIGYSDHNPLPPGRKKLDSVLFRQ